MEVEHRCGGVFCIEKGINRCSGCKITYYCSDACQKATWKRHKPDCLYEALLRRADEHRAVRRKARELHGLDPATGPGSSEQPFLFSRTKRRCDTPGCGVRFTHEYGPDNECPDCGFMVCESCTCHNTRGSCYCYSKNFGDWYCEMNPGWYHAARTDGPPQTFRPYNGDYHPRAMDGVEPSDWEASPRPCNNCGRVTTNLIHDRALVLGSSKWQNEQIRKVFNEKK